MLNPEESLNPLDAMAEEYLERLRRGDRPTIDEYTRRHPDLAAEILAFFPMLPLMAEVAPAQYDTMLPRDDPRPMSRSCPEESLAATVAGSDPIARISDESTWAQSSPEAAARSRHEFSIPGYEILGELGRGGMGVVYKARNTVLDRFVALKMILSGGHTSPEALGRFRAESVTVAKVQHQNIVQIFHVGEHDGLPFFEMEFLPGGSFADRLRGEPLPQIDAVRIAEALARGISEAHRLGIVHRDLKPANVLIAEDGTPKVADFGLAKFVGSDSGVTRTDSILGSPCYMAPEQARGETRDVGPAADIYALGAILYEFLTGRPPFRGATVLETLGLVKDVDPVPPTRLVPAIPRDLETIVLHCLRKEPEARYASTMNLAEDLRRFRAGESILARRTGSFRRAWLWAKRNPNVAALSALAVGLLMILALGSTLGLARLSRERSVAESADRLRRTELAKSLLTALPDNVPFLLNSLGPARDEARSLLRGVLDEPGAGQARRVRAAAALTILGEDRSHFLIDRIESIAGDEAGNVLHALRAAPRSACLDSLRSAYDRAQLPAPRARLAATMLDLGKPEAARSMLSKTDDPTDRVALIRSFPAWHGNLADAADWLRCDDPAIRSGLVVALGLIEPDRLSTAWPPLLDTIQKLYRDAPDAATHSAAGWALRHWREPLPTIPVSPGAAEGRGWFVNEQGLTMIETPPGLLTLQEPWRNSTVRRLVISRPLFFSDSEISAGLYNRFRNDPDVIRTVLPIASSGGDSPSDDHPASSVSWIDAIQFCNWLSRVEGRTPCYVPDPSQPCRWRCLYATDGYRLPTVAEWEYACRAGSERRYAVGDRPEALTLFTQAIGSAAEPTRSRPPNGFGLFDVNGNVWEWINDSAVEKEAGTLSFAIDPIWLHPDAERLMCGGAFDSGSNDFKFDKRYPMNIEVRSYAIGFRVVTAGREDVRTARLIASLGSLACYLGGDGRAQLEAREIWNWLANWHSDKAWLVDQPALYSHSASAYAKSIELDPDNEVNYDVYACSLAFAGERDAYRHACRLLIDRFSQGRSRTPSVNFTLACCLLPDAIPGLQDDLARWAEQTSLFEPNIQLARLTQGFAYYRAGQPRRAIEVLRTQMMTPYSDSVQSCILAMAHQELGQTVEAKYWMDRATTLDREARKEPGPIDGIYRNSNSICRAITRLLFQEAASILPKDRPNLPADVFAP